ESGNPELQKFTLNVTTMGNSASLNSTLLLPIIGAIVAGVAIIGSIVGFIIFRRRQQEAAASVIDTDILAASYGRPVESLRQNTPDPNLDTHGAAEGTFQEQPLQ